MNNFFRKIRLKMLSGNKFRKYIVYAIGEIILVVIGILIALQINTFNQNLQRAKLEKVLLEQVKMELIGIYSDIRFDFYRFKQSDSSFYKVSSYINEDVSYQDSMCFDFYWIKFDEYVYPAEAAYSRLKEEGLDIIRNDTIRLYLQSMYEGLFPRLMKNNALNPDISEVFNDYYLDAFKPNIDYALKFNIDIENDTIGGQPIPAEAYSFPYINAENGSQHTIGYIPLNFEALKKDTKFHMLLEQTKGYRNYKLSRYSYAKTYTEEVVNLIDKELKLNED